MLHTLKPKFDNLIYIDFYENYLRQLQIYHLGIGFIKHIVILNTFMMKFTVFQFSVLGETLVMIYLPLQEVG